MKAGKARTTAIALAGILALSACSGTTSAETAAVVDGRVITEEQVREATAEINEAFNPQEPLTAAQILTLLIRAPYVNDAAAQAGQAQSESAARALPQLAGLSGGPSDATVEILRAEASLQAVDTPGRQALTQKFAELDMEINPRYGRFDPSQASLVATSPNWLVPAAPAASPSPAQ